MPPFVSGAQLSRDFYIDILEPALGPIEHAAGLFGPGSDVLGYDTPRSTDHDWGPRATVFVGAADVEPALARVHSALPLIYRGWPVEIGRDHGPTQHQVRIRTWSGWLNSVFGFDVTGPITSVDWLLMPTQRLLEVVAGPVFADPTGMLTDVRRRLQWYPDELWWWLMASGWRRLAQEEPLVWRTAELGDDLGTAMLIGRHVRDIMRLALLMARRYPPYWKWLGTAFRSLPHADGLPDLLRAALRADASEAPALLGEAWRALASRHADLPGARALDPSLRAFWDRPARVLDANRFAADCRRQVEDPMLYELPLIGGIDQVCDNTDVLLDPALIARLRALYGR